jgi:hypothetical protein
VLHQPARENEMTNTTALLAQDAAGVDAYADAEESAMAQDDFDGLVEDGPSEDDVTFYVEEILSGRYDDEKDARDADYGDWAEDTYDADYEADRACDAWERSFWGD